MSGALVLLSLVFHEWHEDIEGHRTELGYALQCWYCVLLEYAVSVNSGFSVSFCRLKDEPAKGLYDKAGYELEKEDCLLVALWDNRRRLLSKYIPQQPAVQEEAEAPEEETEPFVTEY